MKTTTIVSLVLTGIGASVIATAAPASAASFSFSNITNGDTVGDAFANNFSFNVTNTGNNTVLFRILNNASGSQASQALKQVTFSVDPTRNGLLSNMALNINNTGTVNFQSNSQNLSQSNNISGWDGTTFGADTKGANSNAVQGGESLGISFNANFNDVIAALNARTLMLGIHVGSLPAGASDSYVNTVIQPPTTSVPEPSTLVGAGLAFGFASLLKGNNKKQKQQKAQA